ncbi:Signal-Regulatory Protein Beta-2, partial [Manis pentadactyla]
MTDVAADGCFRLNVLIQVPGLQCGQGDIHDEVEFQATGPRLDAIADRQLLQLMCDSVPGLQCGKGDIHDEVGVSGHSSAP